VNPSNASRDSISVAIPAYNEEANLERAIREALMELDQTGREHEVLVVNDGSQDRTGEIAEALAAENPRVRVIHHHQNQGWSGALQSLFGHARGDLVFLIPADNQHDMTQLPEFLERIKGADIVCGWRQHRADPWPRRLTGWLRAAIVRLSFRLPVHDVTWVKLFRREVLRAIPLDATSVFLDDEILIRAHQQGYRLTELPVRHFPRTAGTSTGNRLRVIWRGFLDLAKLWGKLHRLPRRPRKGTP
jgi:glycosyltransferase involved in cell wall biosynthesis